MLYILYMISDSVNTQNEIVSNFSSPPASPWGQTLDPVLWMAQIEDQLQQLIQSASPNMGHLEELLEREARKLMRPVLEQAAQKLIERSPLNCPNCHSPLCVEDRDRKRAVNSTFGPVTLTRDYGWCARCQDWFYPADFALGLHIRAGASPRIQEICALMVVTSPAAQAQKNIRRITGHDLSASTMHREARRQGERAIQLRETDIARSKLPGGISALSARSKTPDAPFTLVIEIDAWNIRERDDWGKSEQLRKKKIEPSRWHWVFVGTVFRLDQRGVTAGKRPVITQRGYVATRKGLPSYEEQLHVEALQRGLLQADKVLIIADGAVWIWNLAKDRFKDAVQRIDAYHVKEHLWAVAHDIYGQGTPESIQWITPLLKYLDRRNDGALDVIEQLSSLRARLSHLTEKQQDTLDREINYFDTHKDRMDYKKARTLGEPIGSGAIESTCRQYERRFKCMGQFWSLAGDESLMALETLHRNERWNTLFPHASPTPSELNL